MELTKTLAQLRRKCGLTQASVVEYLNQHTAKNLTVKAISHWESGSASPSVELFLLLCDLYQVDDIRRTFRGVDTMWSGSLNERGKRRLEEYAALLAGNPNFRNNREETFQSKTIKLFDLPVSAGVGSFLDSDSYEEIEVDDSVPDNADYAVRISGDSMTPRFVDKQIVFVKAQPTVELGEIGIFVLNEESYCKKLGQGKLISLNTDYRPIPIHEYDSFAVLGKVEG